ncbi:MAG: carbohydrate ABC transporter substrate-binding protein [Gammaproteobacteria bacterium]|nr:carbohydrate ABC transporter substrate-binding protein [Gammaproteobacteria bacterium]MDH3447516.1 carbohydrate ABC transporter substrate-binding protein [Gammaproteobacteria bacterium]
MIPRRRRFLGIAGATIAGSFLIPKFAHAQKKHRLTILQWNHFVPEFDRWFDQVFAKQWGDDNDTEVVIDRVGITSLNSRAQAEIQRGRGHDLFMFLRPPPTYEDFVIDHAEIYQELERYVGKPNEIGLKSTYNPVTKKYFGFSDSYVPDPINYRKDLWDDVGLFPDSWDNIREGGAAIYRKHNIPVGIGLAPELDSNMALRSLMHSFGASVHDEDGRIVLNSPETVEAVKFMKSLYRDAMTEEVFSWDPSSNNRMMLAGHGSLTFNAISITRTGESQKIPIADNILLAPAARGPVRRIGSMHLMHAYVIWKFARNIDGAQHFLVDYVRNFRDAFLASRFYNLPCFPATVPDIDALVAVDEAATPGNKYSVLSQADEWTTTIGYPGYANAVIDETFGDWVISDMFSAVARDRSTPEESVKIATKKADAIYSKWKAAGKV